MTKEHFLKNYDTWLRAAKGEKLQVKDTNLDKWKDIEWETPEYYHINSDASALEWRIKPEPRKFKIAIDKASQNFEIARTGIYAGYDPRFWEIITVTEDMPNESKG